MTSMRIKDGQPLALYYEDYKPLERRRNNLKIAGWHSEAKSGAALEWDGTYNDQLAGVLVAGECVQAVSVQGKNLFDKNKLALENSPCLYYNGSELEVSNYAGGSVSYGSQLFTYVMNIFKVGVTYTVSRFLTLVSGSISGACGSIRFYNATNGAYQLTGVGEGYTGSRSFTIDSDFFDKWNVSGTTLIFYGNTDGTDVLVKYSNIQIELGSTATAYAPFVPNSPSPDYPSSLRICGGDPAASNASLIYGGGHLWTDEAAKLAIPALPGIIVPDTYAGYTYIGADGKRRVADTWDVGTGERIPNAGIKVLTGAVDEGWVTYNASGWKNGFTAYRLDIGASGALAGFCTHLKKITTGDILTYTLSGIAFGGSSIYVCTRAADLASWKAFLAAEYAAGRPVTVAYILATPVTSIITDPAQLPTFPRHTVLTQDGAVGGWLTASAKVMD